MEEKGVHCTLRGEGRLKEGPNSREGDEVEIRINVGTTKYSRAGG